MNISYNTIFSNKEKNNGYGTAGHNIVSSLRALGHNANLDDPDSDIQFFFVQPEHVGRLDSSKYNIIYTPWESSVLPMGWVGKFNLADEVWTTSQLCANWYSRAGVSKPIRVYEHGIESFWRPRLRGQGQSVKFLHIGEPAPRKGGQMVVDAFMQLPPEWRLTIKAFNHNTTRVYESGGFPQVPRSIICNVQDRPNITVITDPMTEDELLSLYLQHDVLVYPSWGEGFGLIPLQALATGMPVICPDSWAPYANFLGPLALNSTLSNSPWPIAHPGDMFRPSETHLLELMREAAANISVYSKIYYDQAAKVHETYNWIKLTKQAFAHLENR